MDRHRVPVVSGQLLRARFGDLVDVEELSVRVTDLRWYPTSERVQGAVADTPRAAVSLRFRGEELIATRCTCSTSGRCTHVLAVIDAAAGNVLPVADLADKLAGGDEWRFVTKTVVKEATTLSGAPASDSDYGVLFVVNEHGSVMATPGRYVEGEWRSSGRAWSELSLGDTSSHGALVTAIGHFADRGEVWLDLGACHPEIWPVLRAAFTEGVPMLPWRGGTDVSGEVAVTAPDDLRLRAVRREAAVELVPHLERVDTAGMRALMVGAKRRRFDGVALHDQRTLCLVPLAAPAPALLGRLLERATAITIPLADIADFRESYLDALNSHVPVHDPDDAFGVAVTEGPTAVLSMTPHGSLDMYKLQWTVRYEVDGEITDDPVDQPDRIIGYRDDAAEKQLWQHVVPLVDSAVYTNASHVYRAPRLTTGLHDFAITVRPIDYVLSPEDAARFVTDHLPQLRTVDGLVVSIGDGVPDFRPATQPPVIRVEKAPGEVGRDWLSLSLVVEIGGRRVPLEQLIEALARGADRIVLPDGLHFTADIPQLKRLSDLLAEARSVGEISGDGLVSVESMNSTLWQDILDIAEPDAELEVWAAHHSRIAAASLARAVEPDPLVHAELRDYQREGLAWLSFLCDNSIGGILADDMGLGKTLQLLSTMAYCLRRDPDARFLVIAPTSVVGNWLREVARFVPSIAATAVRSTLSTAGRAVADRARAATLVVTTFNLVRMDADFYQQQNWAMVVIDEAQFVKNHKVHAHRAIASIPAATKIATTGTPVENSLMDLWSLLALTTPTLFADKAAFNRHYRSPIEDDHDAERTQQLRQRIRPFLLRRTKEQVATELPPKQEQTIELELSPEHRDQYDLLLNRERQKALDLLEADSPEAKFLILQSLTLLRQMSLHAGLIDNDHLTMGSVKIDYLVHRVPQLAKEGHQCLVFSVYPRFLRILEQHLSAAGLKVAFLDGTTSTDERAQQQDSFNRGDADVFLISIRAGGFGINLIAASYVYICDPWWNPAVESQAVDRAHRIGQTKPVNVCRLIAADTIDSKVVDLQTMKRDLADTIVDNDGAFASALTSDDLCALIS